MLKTIPKILVTIFLSIFILQLAGVIFLLAIPKNSQAITFTPQVGVGDFEKGTPETVGNSTAMIGEYIKAIYRYALGIVGILATVVLMFGGVLWIIAGGNAERIANAKSWIVAALTGLVLALTSYMILYIVNPGLVNFRVTPVGDVKGIVTKTGCCEYADSCDPFPLTLSACKEKGGIKIKPGYFCYQNKCIEDVNGCCQVRIYTGLNYYIGCEQELMTQSECDKESYMESFTPYYECDMNTGECVGGTTGDLPI